MTSQPSHLMKSMMKRSGLDLSQAPSMQHDQYSQQQNSVLDWRPFFKKLSESTQQGMEDLNKAYFELLKNSIEDLHSKIDSLTARQRETNELTEETLDSLVRVIGAATTGQPIDEQSLLQLQKFVLRNQSNIDNDVDQTKEEYND